nr:transcription initiation factor TFIID subunit 4-like [Aegilops tauschii subsp. strangulata]
MVEEGLIPVEISAMVSYILSSSVTTGAELAGGVAERLDEEERRRLLRARWKARALADYGSPRGDAPALLPPAPPALPAPSAGDPAAPLSPPPPSSLSPGPPGRVVWADLAEDADRAAGRPVECRDRVPPPAPARPPPSRSAGGLTPGGGSSAARTRTRPSRRLPRAPPGVGEKGKDLGPGIGRRRRRNAGWGVAGRADFGPARSSWCSSGRLALARPAAPPQVVGSPALSRRSPFRPFIAFFGSSRLCCSTSPVALPRLAPPP